MPGISTVKCCAIHIATLCTGDEDDDDGDDDVPSTPVQVSNTGAAVVMQSSSKCSQASSAGSCRRFSLDISPATTT